MARTSLPFSAQTNDVAPCANDVLRNDVMLCINELALCANGKMRQFKPKRKTAFSQPFTKSLFFGTRIFLF